MNTLPRYLMAHCFEWIGDKSRICELFGVRVGWHQISPPMPFTGAPWPSPFPALPLERPEFTLVPSPAVRELADYLE